MVIIVALKSLQHEKFCIHLLSSWLGLHMYIFSQQFARSQFIYSGKNCCKKIVFICNCENTLPLAMQKWDGIFISQFFSFFENDIFFAISTSARGEKLGSAFALMSSIAGAINQVALQKGSYLYLHIEFEKYEQKVDLGGGILLYNLPQKVNQNRQKHLLNKSQAANQGIFLGHSKALCYIPKVAQY